MAGVRVAASRAAAEIPLGALALLLRSDSVAEPDAGRLAEVARQDLAALAGEAGLLVFVDDFPALDRLSLGLLCQQAAAGRILLVGTVRSGEPMPDALAALWSGDRTVRIDLADLDRAGMDALLHEALGDQVEFGASTVFWQACRGNPLYLRELLFGAAADGTLSREAGVWHLVGELPSSPRLLELVGDRIRAVGGDGRAVLDLLALCQPLGLDELATVRPIEALEELESSGLIQVRTDRRRHEVTLAHPVYAQVLQSSMTRIRARATLTGQALRVEEHGLRRREDPLRVATWRLAATGTADAKLLLRAGRLARHTADHAGLERLARGALAAEDSVEARVLLSEALHAQCRSEEADGVLAAATELAAPDSLRQRLAQARAIVVGWGLGRLDDGIAILDAACRELPEPLHGELSALAAMQLAFAEQPVLALARFAAPAVDARPSRLRAIAEAYALASTGACERAEAVLVGSRRPWATDEPESMFVHQGSELMAEALVDYAAGRLLKAAAAMTQALHYAVEDGLAQAQASYSWLLGRILLASGRPRAAARWARDGIAVARARGLVGPGYLATACLATALAQVGDAEQAMKAVEELSALPSSVGMVAQARAWAAAVGGDATRGSRILLDAAYEAAEQERRATCIELLHDAARLGAASQARSLLRDVAVHCDQTTVGVRAAYVSALADQDPVGLQAAVEQFAESGMMLAAAEAASAAAAAWQERGGSRQAALAAARAAELAALCEGAQTPLLVVQARSVGTLTQRESEICRLAAEGMASRTIAEQLFLSVRTVNNHLQNAYTKLGVASRVELVSVLAG
ncbi:LuxR C-terminal-related transcriptional regulator [Catenulispora yoronensis]